MNKSSRAVVRAIDRTNEIIGYFSLYLVLVMMGIMLFESVSRTIFNRPHLWAVELTEFVMAAYYTLGGGYSHIIDSHVRMDILYGRLSNKTKAILDVATFPLIAFYLIVLFKGAIKATSYAIVYHQKTYSPWAPPVAPVKLAMTIGIFFMFLQVISELLKDIARVKGEEIPVGEVYK